MFIHLNKTPKKTAYSLIFVVALLSTFYNAFIPLHGDEAYYWVWSHHLQAGYYDHPPMIAYLLALSNFVSESPWGVRLVNIVSMSIAALYTFKLTSLITDEKTALNSLFIFLSVIIVHAGYIIATPDSPLIMFWSLSMYYAYRAIFYGLWKDYILAGLMFGLMMLSKYNAILLVTAVLLFIIFKKRTLFLEMKFYIALLIAFAIILPMLYWNYRLDWISFTFQLNHGTTNSYTINFIDALGFLLGQFGIFTPIFTGVLFYYLIKDKNAWKNEKIFFILLTIIIPLVFFTYKSLFKSMGLNYAAPAYIGGAIFVSYIISNYNLSNLFKWGIIIALTLSLIGRYLMIFHLDKIQDRMYKSDKVVEWFYSHKHRGDALYGTHLTIASYITYYTPDHTDSQVIPKSRFSQYSLWKPFKLAQNAIILSLDNDLIPELKLLYSDVSLIDKYIVIPKKRIFYIYKVKNPLRQEEF